MTTRERSRYFEFQPPPALSERVLCLWRREIGGGGEHLQPVLPDGCVDIVWIGRAAPVVAGPATRRVLVALPPGTTLLGVRFNPGWAAALLGPPAHQLLNQHVPLADIWERKAGLFAELVSGDQPAPARLRRLLETLANRFAGSRAADPVVLEAVRWLARHPAGRMRDLARLSGVSNRQLHRRFRAAVGYGPKVFQRVMRFQRLLAAASRRRNLAHLAASLGYADQAHMCREVHALAGKPPLDVLGRAGSTLLMSDLFNTDDPPGDYSRHDPIAVENDA